jgi:phospholipid/cholesterol/gamma-HCH transport system substrate-binding protein
MAQRRSLAWTELRVGILVITSFVLLAFAIFVISGESGFLTEKYDIKAFFANANNLKTGAEVQLEGVTIGNVRSVAVSRLPDANKAVEVELRLDERFKNIIRTDSKLSIGTIGLLGEAAVNITRGTDAGQVIEENGEVVGTEEGDIRRIVQGTNDFIANLEVLSDQVKRMAERVDRGEGTLGKFLTDSAIYDNTNLAIREGHLLVRDARTGTGTIGKLMSDDELYRALNASLGRMDTLIAKIESGPGTAGKFINDPAIYNRTEELLVSLQRTFDRIDRGEGTIGKFLTDDALYNDMRATMNRFSTLVAAIENGQGTAGKFITDPTLFNSLNQTSSEIQKLIYDVRQNPQKFLTINFRLF